MFHVELRQFPHVARAFNLTEEELDERILRPWASGAAIELQERRWVPRRAKLSIYEGPRLEVADMGIGRGWANVTRTGTEVTAARLAAVPDDSGGLQEELKAALVARAQAGPLTAAGAMAAARDGRPGIEDEELAMMSARAIWQLLAERRLILAVPRESHPAEGPRPGGTSA